MSSTLTSSIVKKLIMSISGMFLIVFLLIHLVMNFTAVISRQAYEATCGFMDNNIIIQGMVPVLALGFTIHIAYGFILTIQNRKSRPDKYEINCKTKISWASKNMFVLGLIVLGFLGMHLTHFWAKMQLQHYLGGEAENPYDLVQNLFTNWYYVLMYIVWILTVNFHISHGFWSMFQTIGINNSKWIPRLKAAARIYAHIVMIGFIIIPIYFFFFVGN